MRPQILALTLLLILAISIMVPACSSSSSSTESTPAIGGPGEDTPVSGSPTPPTLLFTPLPPGYEKTAIPPTPQSKAPSTKPQQPAPTAVPRASATRPPSPTTQARGTPGAATPATLPSQNLGLIVKDGNISLGGTSIQTGKMKITVENKGVDLHAIAIKGPGVDTRTDQIEPGKSTNKEITFDQSGSYELFCPIDGHRQKGESVTIQVK